MKLPFFFKKKKSIPIGKIFPKIKSSIKINNVATLNKSDKYDPIILSVSGNYLVADNYSDTLNNEKKLIDNLIENISTKALEAIGQRLDDI